MNGTTVFIGLGSNLGDRHRHLDAAVEKLRHLHKTKVVAVSRWHETDPMGGPPQGNYLNGVAEIETPLNPRDLLSQLQRIEQEMGRPAHHEPWGPRTLDLDLLSYDSRIIHQPGLEIPHPRMHQRPFVLIPLAELAPEWKHPALGRTARELLSLTECKSSTDSKSCAG